MVSLYAVILIVSSAIVALSATRISGRLHSLFGFTSSALAGSIALWCTVAFLTAIAASPAMLTAAAVLWLCTRTPVAARIPTFAQWAIPMLLAAWVAGTHPLPELPVPPALALAGVALLLFICIALGRPHAGAPAAPIIVLSLLPVIGATAMGGPTYLALDSGIVAAALLGTALAASPMTLGRTLPAWGMVIGWLLLQPALHGIWVASIAGLALYVPGMLYAASRPRPMEGYVA